MGKWPSAHGQPTKIRLPDGCKRDAVHLAVDQWYDFHEFGCHLGNVGYNRGVALKFESAIILSATKLKSNSMRIIKLSKAEFSTLADVQHFFSEELCTRMPPGKFRVTVGRIAKDALELGEQLVITHQARAVFTAQAGSGLVANDDEEQVKYPNYFIVDLATLKEADEDLYEVERWYNDASGAGINIVKSQGWNRLTDSNHTHVVWKRLRGA